MAIKRWIITDISQGKYEDRLLVAGDELGGRLAGVTIKKHTLRGGLSDGVDVIHINNGKFSFVVLPTRGMSVWKGWLGELEVGWRSPVHGPVHPKFVPLSDPTGLGWLDGFDEWIVRCGLESNGAPDFSDDGQLTHPLHGRIANKPAQYVELATDSDTGEITLNGVVEESRFLFTKLRLTTSISTSAGEPGLRIRDTVENYGGVDGGMQMLYHVNFGQPLLDAGSQIIAPVKTCVPRNEPSAAGVNNWGSFPSEKAGSPEHVYFLELAAAADGQTQTLLKNALGNAGATLRFNKNVLPCFSVWKNPAAAEDGYVTGLEPATNFPNPRSYEAEQDRVVNLPPGGGITFDLAVEIHGDANAVDASEEQIKSIQASTEPHIYAKPQKGWTADA